MRSFKIAASKVVPRWSIIFSSISSVSRDRELWLQAKKTLRDLLIVVEEILLCKTEEWRTNGTLKEKAICTGALESLKSIVTFAALSGNPDDFIKRATAVSDDITLYKQICE